MKWPSRSALWGSLVLGLILLFLACTLMCVSSRVLLRAQVVRVQADLKDLRIAIKNFQVEYNAYPAPTVEHASDDFTTDTASPLIDCLVGKNVWGNQREIEFIDPPLAKNGKGGLIEAKNGFQTVDTWGHPFQVILDANGDNRVLNPDAKNTDPTIREGAPPELPTGVAVFSLGPDGIAFTSDDFTSWRGAPVLPVLLVDRMLPHDWIALVGLGLVIYAVVGLVLRDRKA